ncbi:UNKNOWN [Stylonychia lemnae]|uniref:Uncharacterized protein n=1 Tax=Stylonychia lemnae TaxID=5949 RepID=A0A078ANK3_STYLE|nr:UNKNOWN [Stylonychia lemnae]|eukprot:CDW83754.1 UNKNOWN [Stylonychia lemnae]
MDIKNQLPMPDSQQQTQNLLQARKQSNSPSNQKRIIKDKRSSNTLTSKNQGVSKMDPNPDNQFQKGNSAGQSKQNQQKMADDNTYIQNSARSQLDQKLGRKPSNIDISNPGVFSPGRQKNDFPPYHCHQSICYFPYQNPGLVQNFQQNNNNQINSQLDNLIQTCNTLKMQLDQQQNLQKNQYQKNDQNPNNHSYDPIQQNQSLDNLDFNDVQQDNNTPASGRNNQQNTEIMINDPNIKNQQQKQRSFNHSKTQNLSQNVFENQNNYKRQKTQGDKGEAIDDNENDEEFLSDDKSYESGNQQRNNQPFMQTDIAVEALTDLKHTYTSRTLNNREKRKIPSGYLNKNDIVDILHPLKLFLIKVKDGTSGEFGEQLKEGLKDFQVNASRFQIELADNNEDIELKILLAQLVEYAKEANEMVLCKLCIKLVKRASCDFVHTSTIGSQCIIQDNYCADCLLKEWDQAQQIGDFMECPQCFDIIQDQEIQKFKDQYQQAAVK